MLNRSGREKSHPFLGEKGVLKEGTARALERELQSEEAALLSEEKLSQKERLSRMDRTSFLMSKNRKWTEKSGKLMRKNSAASYL